MTKIDNLIKTEFRFSMEKQGNGGRIAEGFIMAVEDLYNKQYRNAGVIKLLDASYVDENGKLVTFLVS